MSASKPESALECAREALREYVVRPIAKEISGSIVEVYVDEGGIRLRFYADYDDYNSGKIVEEDQAVEPAELALWLFGPERVVEPSKVYRLLSAQLAEGATVLVSSESPWPGKILSPGEFGEYTSEETSAALTRAGFEEIGKLIEGPFFRLWHARRSAGSVYLALCRAEDHLSDGEWEQAEQHLAGVNEPLGSHDAVREYALLVAACHDLAGRSDACLDALTEALKLDPRCARAMCGLGRIAALRGDLGSAADFFESALRIQPSLVAAHHGRAVIKEAEGEIAEAFASMMTASDLRPKDDDIMLETVRLGNAAGAGDAVSKFLEHRLGGQPLTSSLSNAPNQVLRAEADLS